MFNGMGGMGNVAGMVKKMQQMQTKMVKLQEELKTRTVEGTAGGGAVTVTVSGKKELVAVKIDPEVVDPENVEELQDLVMLAVNNGMRDIDKLMETEMAKITGGMKIPGLM